MSRSRRTPRRTPRRSLQPQTVIRVTTPAQVVASLPLRLGYTPEESLVVTCCHEPRGRIGLTFRIDLPDPAHEADLVEYVEQVVRDQRSTRVVLVLYTEEADGAGKPRAGLMARLTDAFSDIVVTEALLVRGGRFWSYVCDGPCCPADGTPVDAAEESSAIQVLRLEQLAAGQLPLGTRAELEASLAPPGFLEAEEMRQRFEAQLACYADALQEAGPKVAGRQALQAWRDAVQEAADPRRTLSKDRAAALAASLEDVRVRDAVAALFDEDDSSLRRLVHEVARLVPPPYDAPVCTLLAWVTYCEGAGTVTSLALDRALATDPDYSLALLLRDSLARAVSPQLVRRVARGASRALEDVA